MKVSKDEIKRRVMKSHYNAIGDNEEIIDPKTGKRTYACPNCKQARKTPCKCTVRA